LHDAVGNAPNIDIIDAVWSRAEVSKLYCDADVLLSLHRSEGFGLSIAEAMMVECPTIVTAWSGNMDFCAEDTSFLVAYRLVPFEDNDPSYSKVGSARWAEPDVEAAASHLRELRNNPEKGRATARLARERLVKHIASNSYTMAVRSLIGSGL
jgi:glycosyltransferase involved in cell wall biosynthesis